MKEQEFEWCIRQIQAGDKEGLRQIYEAYAGLVYSVVYSMVGQKEDAQDLTADFFIRLWERADAYRFGGKHKGWMLTIARNMALDFLRKRKRELLVEELEEKEGGFGDIAEEVIGNLSFREAVQGLKPQEREVLDMKILGQMTFQEIGNILKKPQGTVAWLYRQGIGKLRRSQRDGGKEVQR